MRTVGLITFLLSYVFVIIYERHINVHNQGSLLFVQHRWISKKKMLNECCWCRMEIESNWMNLPVTEHLIIFIVHHFSLHRSLLQLADCDLICLPLEIATWNKEKKEEKKNIDDRTRKVSDFFLLCISNENFKISWNKIHISTIGMDQNVTE